MKVNIGAHELKIEHPTHKYILTLKTDYPMEGDFPIEEDFNDVSFRTMLNGDFCCSTGRNLAEYGEYKNHFLTPGKISDPSKQYLEVGAGIGEFVPYLVRKFGKTLKNKPIVIDPINYTGLREMLDFSKALELPERIDRKVSEFIARIDIITDPNRVRLTNTTLLKAISKHPELIGSADYVVDHAASRAYPTTEFSNYPDLDHLEAQKQRRRIERGLASLLNSNGVLFG
jgi:hypothetical protein